MSSYLISMRSYWHKTCIYFMSCMWNSFIYILYTFLTLILDNIQHYKMSHMNYQNLSKILLGIKHKKFNWDNFCSLSHIECILILLNFSSILEGITVNNFYRVSKNLQGMMCIDLIKDCMFCKDWDIFNISWLLIPYTFHQHIEAHISRIEWLNYWQNNKFSLRHSRTLLYKRYTSHCQDITDMDLNISHILCDNSVYSIFLGINFYIHHLIGHKNILICKLNIQCLMCKFNMDSYRRNIDGAHRHCNCLMDKFTHTFWTLNKCSKYLDIVKYISMRSSNNWDYHIWYKYWYLYIKYTHLHTPLHI